MYAVRSPQKRTLWENAAHVPLIMRVPWMKASLGKRTPAIVELVDVRIYSIHLSLCTVHVRVVRPPLGGTGIRHTVRLDERSTPTS